MAWPTNEREKYGVKEGRGPKTPLPNCYAFIELHLTWVLPSLDNSSQWIDTQQNISQKN
jgi:hypothetical protein